MRKLIQNGTISNLHKGNGGRRGTARTLNNIDAVHNAVRENECISCRPNEVGLSSSSFNKIVR